MDAIISLLKTAAEFSGFVKRTKDIKGWLHVLEGYALMTLAELGPGVGEIVEIGSYMGKSTCWLAHGSKKVQREKIHAIDHFQGSPEHQEGGIASSEEIKHEGTTYNKFLENIKSVDLDDYVNPVPLSSLEAVKTWDKKIRLLFIDGEHTYEGVKNDFEAWSKFVVPAGIIAFHDYGNPHFPGVKKFYSELMNSTDEYRDSFQVVKLKAIQKKY
ncbi:MAG: class I SAM-dependent methyltransferase [Thermodesulfobacteriota bacterium]|nr:class I SAM-dependent methyltransferase [Thermodesulfobacteriota bacterium]